VYEDEHWASDVVTSAVLGAAIGLALTPFTPPGVPIIAASAACLLGWKR
jgi:membrane-associated phospholipid phosphatase